MHCLFSNRKKNVFNKNLLEKDLEGSEFNKLVVFQCVLKRFILDYAAVSRETVSREGVQERPFFES